MGMACKAHPGWISFCRWMAHALSGDFPTFRSINWWLLGLGWALYLLFHASAQRNLSELVLAVGQAHVRCP